MEDYFEDNTIEKLNKIRNNETGTPIKILSIVYFIFAIFMIFFGLILGFSSEDTASTIAFIFLGIIFASTLVLIAVGLKMFYEIHFVITHLQDVFQKEKK